jgi:photosystem II stability/assembly factor-like uncharacterized protein
MHPAEKGLPPMSARWRSVAVLLVTSLACTGTGRGQVPRSVIRERPSLTDLVTERIDARVVVPPAPAVRGPTIFVNDLHFLSRAIGYVVGTTRAEGGRATIQSTRDGGRTWRTRWHGSDHDELRWIGADQDGVLHAFGSRFVSGQPSPFGLESHDRGRSWQRFRVELPEQLTRGWYGTRFVFGPSPIVLGYPDPGEAPCCTGPAMRSVDGGRSWTPIRIPGSIRSIDLVDGPVGFAVVGQDRRGCRSSVWKTADAGTTWDLLPASCSSLPFAGSLDFTSSSRGYFAAGRWDQARARGKSELFATTDGGRTWARAWSTRDGPTIARLAFTVGSTGWMALGGCASMGADGPCVGPLRITRDGGRSWERTRLPAYRLQPAGYVLWTLSSRHAGRILWRSRDRGVTWRSFANARTVDLCCLAETEDDAIVVRTTQFGALESDDRGDTWGPVEGRPPREDPGIGDLDRRMIEMPSGPISLRRLRCIDGDVSEDRSRAVVECRDGLFVTQDAGMSWTQILLPNSLDPWEILLGTEGDLWASDDSRLWRSGDMGATWSRVWVEPSRAETRA